MTIIRKLLQSLRAIGLLAGCGLVLLTEESLAMPVIPDRFDTSACLRESRTVCGELSLEDPGGTLIELSPAERLKEVEILWDTESWADHIGRESYLTVDTTNKERSGYKAYLRNEWLIFPRIALMDASGRVREVPAEQTSWSNRGGFRYELFSYSVPPEAEGDVIVGVRLDYAPSALFIVRDGLVENPYPSFAIPDKRFRVMTREASGALRRVAAHVEKGKRVEVSRRYCSVRHGNTEIDFGSIGIGSLPALDEVLRRAVTSFSIRCSGYEDGSRRPVFEEVFLANDRGTLLNSAQNRLKIGNGLVIEASGNDSRACATEMYRFDGTPNALPEKAKVGSDAVPGQIDLHWRLCRDPEANSIRPGRFEAGATVWVNYSCLKARASKATN